MIFVFTEDGRLEVISGPEEARRNYEGIDVESGVFEFFDENGAYLEPRFIKPNKTGRFLGIFRWAESGEFNLVPAPDSCEDIFEYLTGDVEMEPNPWFKNVEEIRRALRKRSGSSPSSSA